MKLMVLLSVDAFVFFKILRALESLWADCTSVWFQRGVDWGVSDACRGTTGARRKAAGRWKRAAAAFTSTSDRHPIPPSQPVYDQSLTSQMARDVIPLDTLYTASLPCAGEAEVVGRFPANVHVAQVVVQVVR